MKPGLVRFPPVGWDSEPALRQRPSVWCRGQGLAADQQPVRRGRHEQRLPYGRVQSAAPVPAVSPSAVMGGAHRLQSSGSAPASRRPNPQPHAGLAGAPAAVGQPTRQTSIRRPSRLSVCGGCMSRLYG